MLVSCMIVTSALLGPVAGGGLEHRFFKHISRFVIGLIFGYLVCGWSWWLLAGAFIILAGAAPGIGHPKGYIIDGVEPRDRQLEWWQPEILRHCPYCSLVLRGCIFGLPAVVVAWWQPGYLILIPAFAAGLPAGMWFGRHVAVMLGLPIAWEASEFFQYPLTALLLIYIMSGPGFPGNV